MTNGGARGRGPVAWFRNLRLLERFTVFQILAMPVGGLLAAYLMRPELEAGPVRISTYVVFGVGSLILFWQYLGIIRRSQDGRASIVVVASCLWWGSFAITGFCIVYLLCARNWGFWPALDKDLQERILYFFISGSAIGLLFKAITFGYIPPQELIERRVSTWPIYWRRRLRAEDREGRPRD